MSETANSEVVILNAALELREPERTAFLDKACAGDAVLRQSVDELLQAHERAEVFLESPRASLDFQRTIRLNIPLTEKPGDKIGRYKLLQQIGEGGCGVVYMAEQEEPVRRRVALKVIKLGMDTKEVIARFEAERQALALMDHPNIAKVLDAGATDTGRPYFVMELVRGIKITDFCDENKTSTEERLKLFIQVCQAIQHAHQKGIIHRDIKPSNILITVNDGVPVPKVIDFGIAKATQGRLTDKTLFTAFEQFIGTPAYMSPEQAVMTSLDIDTRSDIYSLGVLLYELLTGKTPFDAQELLQSGLDAMRRIITEKEPPKPSTRLSTMLEAERTTTARHRQTEPPKLVHLVRGDLDWIVMKSLEKDRARRYETANGLAADIQRHLNNEPVTASPPSGFYRLQKTIQRNKGAFAAAIIIAIVLVTGVIVSTSQAIRATRAERDQSQLRQRAEAEAVKSEQTAQFLKAMLKGAGPSIARGRDATVLREILNKAAARVGQDLANQPEIQGDLFLTLGSAYGDIGDRQRALTNFQRAVECYRQSDGGQRKKLALALGFFGRFQSQTGNVAAGNTNALLAVELARKLDDPQTLASCLISAASSFDQWQFTASSVPYLREALALRKLSTNDPVAMADCMRSLGGALGALDNTNSSEPEDLIRQALALHRRYLEPDNPVIAYDLFALGQTLLDYNQVGEARTVLLETASMFRKFFDKNHPYQPIVLRFLVQAVTLQQGGTNGVEELLRDLSKNNPGQPEFEAQFRDAIGDQFRSLGKDLAAQEMHRQARALYKMIPGGDNSGVAELLDKLAAEASSLENQAEAESLEREALAMRKKIFGAEHLTVAQSLNFLAVVLLRQSQGVPETLKQSKLAEAESLARQALAMREKLLGGLHVDVAASLESIAVILDARGDLAESESLGRHALGIRRQLVGDADDAGVADYLITLADTLNNESKRQEAETLFRQGLAMRKKIWGDASPQVAYALGHLATCVQRQGRLGESEPLYRESLAAWRKSLDERHSYIAGTITILAGVLRDEGKLAEAEDQFREACRIRRKYLGDNDVATIGSLSALAEVLSREGKLAETEKLFDDLLINTAGNSSETARVLNSRGELRARAGHWKEAIPDLTKAVELQTNNSAYYVGLASLLGIAGDLNGYRNLCQRYLSVFGETQDPATAYWIARLCVVIPCPGVDMQRVSRLADLALVSQGTNGHYLSSEQFLKAVVEYRLGHYASAADYADKSSSRKMDDSDDINYLGDYAIIAMANSQLKRSDEAIAALAKADDLARAKVPGLAGGDLGGYWRLWVLAEGLHREAKALIEGQPGAVEAPTPPK